MFSHNLNSEFTWKTSVHWLLLCILSGSVNAGGFLACQRFVTHVTGTSTLIGAELAHGSLSLAIGVMFAPFCFLMGAMAAAFLVDRPFYVARKPRYVMVMAIVTMLLLGATLLGFGGFFGPFGAALQQKSGYLLIALLAGASGLQNAAITSATNATIRTTHMTGTTTDLGLGIVRSFCVRRDPVRFIREVRASLVRFGSVCSFVLGSAVGVIVFVYLGYLGFAVPTFIAAYLTFVVLLGERKHPGYTCPQSRELEPTRKLA